MRIGYARVSTTDQGRRCQAGLLGYWQLTRRGRALIGSIIALAASWAIDRRSNT